MLDNLHCMLEAMQYYNHNKKCCSTIQKGFLITVKNILLTL